MILLNSNDLASLLIFEINRQDKFFEMNPFRVMTGMEYLEYRARKLVKNK